MAKRLDTVLLNPQEKPATIISNGPVEPIDIPLGWRRVAKERQSGVSAGKIDVYYFNSANRVFRSKASIQKYLLETGSDLTADVFNFSSRKSHGTIKKKNNDNRNKEIKDPPVKNATKRRSTSIKKEVADDLTLPKRVKKENKNDRSNTNSSKKNFKRCPPDGNKNDLANQGASIEKEVKKRFGTMSSYFRKKQKSHHEYALSVFRRSLIMQKWTPPRSPFNLLQEEFYTNPWKLLITTILLQKTTGAAVRKVIYKLFDAFPNCISLLTAKSSDIEEILRPIGMHKKRALMLQVFSTDYFTKEWYYPIDLHGVGKYGNDSFKIFCMGEWEDVQPKDHMLIKYHQWLVEMKSCQKDSVK